MDGYEIGLDIIVTSKLIHRYMDSKCQTSELNGGQIRIIGFIHGRSEHGLDTFQKDIENELSIRRSSVTSVLQLMEKNGYIERVSVESDARLKKLVLTSKGQEADRRLGNSIFETESMLKSALSLEDTEKLKDILDRIKAFLKEEEKDV